jgi:hypothetical protein
VGEHEASTLKKTIAHRKGRPRRIMAQFTINDLPARASGRKKAAKKYNTCAGGKSEFRTRRLFHASQHGIQA